MNNKIQFGYLVLLLIIFFVFIASDELLSFEFETVDSYGNAGEWNSMVLDIDGFSHISYTVDADGIMRLMYARWNGERWIKQEVDRNGVGKYNSLDLDNNCLPHIAYWDERNKAVKYARFDGTNWHIKTIHSYGDVLPNYSISLKVDSKGYPHICYTYQSLGSQWRNLMHAFWDGEKWNKEYIRSSKAEQFGEFVSLAIDKYDLPHVVYFIWYPDGGLIYSHIVNSAWHHERVDPEGVAGKNTSIALDSQGYPHISYWRDYGANFRYAYYDGSKWNIEILGNGSLSSIKIDRNDYPHISYMKHIGGGGHQLNYTYKDNLGWHTTLVRSSDVKGNTSLALDYYDQPHITFWDTRYSINDLILVKPNSFGPQAFSLYYPENGEWGNPQDEFRWYPASYQGTGLSHYELWIDNNLYVNNILKSRPFTKIETPLSDGWHTWKVKAALQEGGEIWSTETWSVRIDATPPASFNLLSPKNNSWTNNTQPTLFWDPSSDVGSGLFKYQLFIDGSLNKDDITPSETSTTPSWSLADGDHTWYIVALDNAQYVTQSNQTWILKIDTTPPNNFSLLSPANYSWTGDNTPIFSWNATTDNGIGLSKYQLIIDGNVVIDSLSAGITTATLDSSQALSDGTHYWKIKAYDFLGNARKTYQWTLRVDLTPPNPFSLSSPADSELVNFPTPNFSWDATTDGGSGFSHYQLWIDNNYSLEFPGRTSPVEFTDF